MLPADGMMAARAWSSAPPTAARSKSIRVFRQWKDTLPRCSTAFAKAVLLQR